MNICKNSFIICFVLVILLFSSLLVSGAPSEKVTLEERYDFDKDGKKETVNVEYLNQQPFAVRDLKIPVSKINPKIKSLNEKNLVAISTTFLEKNKDYFIINSIKKELVNIRAGIAPADSKKGKHQTAIVSFRQIYEGKDVWNSWITLFYQNDNLMEVINNYQPIEMLMPMEELSYEEVLESVDFYLQTENYLGGKFRPEFKKEIIYPLQYSNHTNYVKAWELDYPILEKISQKANEDYQELENELSKPKIIVSFDGQILEHFEGIRSTDISGEVSGLIFPQDPWTVYPGYDEVQEEVPLRGITVTVEQNGETDTVEAITDENGLYYFSDIVGNPLINVNLEGPHVVVSDCEEREVGECHSSPRAISYSGDLLDLNFAEIDDTHWDEATNVFWHEDKAYNYFYRGEEEPFNVHPETPFPVYVNVGGKSCNAMGGSGFNVFYVAGRCNEPLSLIADVIYHEFTHATLYNSDNGYGGRVPSMMQEGFADYFGMVIGCVGDGDEEVCDNVHNNAEAGVRERPLEHDLRFPEDLARESHHDGRILAGTLYELRELWKQVGFEGKDFDELIFKSIKRHSSDHILTFQTFLESFLREYDFVYGNGEVATEEPLLEGFCTTMYETHGLYPQECSLCPNMRDDPDNDGIVGPCDNCQNVANPDQSDIDNDFIGDSCDEDIDGDALINDEDNCPFNNNIGQADFDGDGIGDVCDDDVDNDGFSNNEDNCIRTFNPDQADSNDDQIGDACSGCAELDYTSDLQVKYDIPFAVHSILISGENTYIIKNNNLYSFNEDLSLTPIYFDFEDPKGITMGPDGNFYVLYHKGGVPNMESDYWFKIISSEGVVIDEFALDNLIEGPLNYLWSYSTIAVDAEQNIIIPFDDRVIFIEKSSQGYQSIREIQVNDIFYRLKRISLDQEGNIFAAGFYEGVIVKLSPQGDELMRMDLNEEINNFGKTSFIDYSFGELFVGYTFANDEDNGNIAVFDGEGNFITLFENEYINSLDQFRPWRFAVSQDQEFYVTNALGVVTNLIKFGLDTSLDFDNDGNKDSCDDDDDNDGKINEEDNCALIYNPSQKDSDNDGVGNVCDNCARFNPNQLDSNNNGLGDACDLCALTSGSTFSGGFETELIHNFREESSVDSFNVWDNKVALINSENLFIYDLEDREKKRFPLQQNTGQSLSLPIERDHISIWEDIVVWQDDRNGNSDIYLCELGKEISNLDYDENGCNDESKGLVHVASGEINQIEPFVSENFIVWKEELEDGLKEIYAYDLNSGETKRIRRGLLFYYTAFADKIVWNEYVNGKQLLFTYYYPASTLSLTNPNLRPNLHLNGYDNAVVSTGGIMEENSAGESFQNRDIYLLDMITGEKNRLTFEPADQEKPNIWQNWLVWKDERNSRGEGIFFCDLNGYDGSSDWCENEDKGLVIIEDGVYGLENPKVSQNLVVWSDRVGINIASGQLDDDGDGMGNSCDPDPEVFNDLDRDNVSDGFDNCVSIFNPNQLDDDNDGVGNVCDNCLAEVNPFQNDLDEDGIGDSCDNCIEKYNPEQADEDNDEIGNRCDLCPNDSENDRDGDSVCGNVDNCPNDFNPDQLDNDFNGIGNICDINVCISVTEDLDGDGAGNNCDLDNDGDGVHDYFDNCPMLVNANQANSDGDLLGNLCDPLPSKKGPLFDIAYGKKKVEFFTHSLFLLDNKIELLLIYQDGKDPIYHNFCEFRVSKSNPKWDADAGQIRVGESKLIGDLTLKVNSIGRNKATGNYYCAIECLDGCE